ncbi:MAG TPA: gamma-glutamyl-gamma-aminobutyrate hydrolase family protein [Chthoniobacterales bacterium]|nr:gamma-glutamyl-gamma-aminobutyrate hydrolase family protein [Chthoniobacterales bacterium]
MPNLATWMRSKDEPAFGRALAAHPDLIIWNAAQREMPLAGMHGLLLTGGPDVAPEFLRQEIPDPSPIDTDVDPARDRWEFQAIKEALERELPILAICKGLQTLNVALGGTLRLDVPGHNAPEMKDHDIQPLRTERSAVHRLEKVNSSHHQAVDRLGEGFAVEAWCATDDIIEQMRLKNYSFALAVQYHPERGGEVYAPLFADFAARMKNGQN